MTNCRIAFPVFVAALVACESPQIVSDDAGPRDDGGSDPHPRADASLPDGGEARDDAGMRIDGGASYNPCVAGEPCRFMPLGDSITSGYEGGYRVPLFRHALEDEKAITFVGSRANGPDEVDGVPFPRGHEGHDGYYIDSTHASYNIADLVGDAIDTHRPHVIALMIGANDVSREGLPDSAERLAILVDQVLEAAPDALVLLAQITPTQSDSINERVRAYNAEMPAIVESRAAEGKHIALVDMYGAFTAVPDYQSVLMYDNLHPGVEGDRVLARVWYEAIRELLPAR
jgi:lysophospholipase L1-like esterase